MDDLYFNIRVDIDKDTFACVVQQEEQMVEKAGTDTPPNQLEVSSADVQAVANSAGFYQPKTPLGQRLWELRSKIVASNQPLLGWEDIEQEVADRRGEAE